MNKAIFLFLTLNLKKLNKFKNDDIEMHAYKGTFKKQETNFKER